MTFLGRLAANQKTQRNRNIINNLLGEPGGTRTHDPKIKSLVLYRLSYGLTYRSNSANWAPRSTFDVSSHPHVHDSVRVRHGTT